MNRIAVLLLLSLLATVVLAEDKPPAQTATLTVHNRSSYKMTFALWDNGKQCTKRMPLDAANNINLPEPKPFTVAADHAIGINVAILEIQDKAPVQCDLAIMFRLQPGQVYLYEFDVQDRHCYGNLFRNDGGAFKMVVSGDKEKFRERTPAFGWDMSEPGCDED